MALRRYFNITPSATAVTLLLTFYFALQSLTTLPLSLFLRSIHQSLTSSISVSPVQNYLCAVHPGGPVHVASGLHNNRRLSHPASSTSAWICIRSLAFSNTWVHSHRTDWTDAGSATDCRSGETLSQSFSSFFFYFCVLHEKII